MAHPITLDQAVTIAPAIATDHAHPYKGEGFVHINSLSVLEALHDVGFRIASVKQARGTITTRGIDTGLYNQHVVRLRHMDAFNELNVGDSVAEIVFRNSHDGSGCIDFLAGLFRLVCSNGMTVGEMMEKLKLQHRWTNFEEVIRLAQRIWEFMPILAEWQKKAEARILEPEEQNLFAHRAQIIRFPDRTTMPFEAGQLLNARRTEDAGVDLWHTFQRVQENLIKGGIEGRSATGRLVHMREITGVGSDIDINRQLWDLADSYLEAA